MVEVLHRAVPVLDLLQEREHGVAGHGLDPTELVRQVLGGAHGKGQTARTDEHGGDPVADRLPQFGSDLHLGVVVGVQVDEAGCDPLARGVDHLGVVGGDEVDADLGHDPVADQDVGHDARTLTGTVEHGPAPDHQRAVDVHGVAHGPSVGPA